MNRLVPWLLAGLVLVAAACSSPTDLEPAEACGPDQSDYRASFADPALEVRVRSALGVGAQVELTCSLVARVTELDASDAAITSLLGLQNLVNLRYLDLGGNDLSDLTPLSTLGILHTFLAPASGITSLSGLEGLGSLTFLDLSENSVVDLTPISGLRSLYFVDLTGNAISDVGPLGGLSGLVFLYLDDNSITDLGPVGGLNVVALHAGTNSIVDISALSGLTTVTSLKLDSNSIVDLTALAALPGLASLDLSDNFTLSDIQPLLDNDGLGEGDTVNLRGTAVDCISVNALRAKGVFVDSGCPVT